jgi:hypothetical protein
MPKFKRCCGNPFHEQWTNNDGGLVVNLTARGLLSLSKVFESFVEAEVGKKAPRGVKFLCTSCLGLCFKKRKFTRFLPKDSPELERKVQRQVCKVVIIFRKKLLKLLKKIQKKNTSFS